MTPIMKNSEPEYIIDNLISEWLTSLQEKVRNSERNIDTEVWKGPVL